MSYIKTNFVDGVTALSATEMNKFGAGIANVTVVDDTTPQLGGELDCQGHTVGFTETDNGNSGTAKAIDWRLSNHQKILMTGNCVFTFISPSKPCALTLMITNDATTGRTITLPTVKWVGGTAPVWTKTANAIDFLQLYWNGTFYIAQAALNCV